MVTLEQIALEAGVSRGTVANALSGRNKETWGATARRGEEIRAIAERLGYRPNAAAKAIRSGRFGAIGLVTSRNPSNGGIFEHTFLKIRQELSQRDMHLTIGDLPDEDLTSEQIVPKLLREWSADGLLISYTAEIPPRLRELIQQHHIPSVWLNTHLDSDCVYPDDLTAAKQATEHLLKLGHEKIAYVSYNNSLHYSASERREGYLAAMREARLEPRVMEEHVEHQWAAQEFSKGWLGASNRPTAVVAYEAVPALAIYCAALRMGLDIPNDFSILAFHETTIQSAGEMMTTMRLPSDEMATVATEMLMQKIEDPSLILPPRALAATLYEGSTCAPPRS